MWKDLSATTSCFQQYNKTCYHFPAFCWHLLMFILRLCWRLPLGSLRIGKACLPIYCLAGLPLIAAAFPLLQPFLHRPAAVAWIVIRFREFPWRRWPSICENTFPPKTQPKRCKADARAASDRWERAWYLCMNFFVPSVNCSFEICCLNRCSRSSATSSICAHIVSTSKSWVLVVVSFALSLS